MDDLYLGLENIILNIGVTGSTIFNFTQVWNNQLEHLKSSDDYMYQLPCVLLEMNTTNFNQLGCGYQNIDMNIKFHIIQDFYNGDNMSENLSIFTLRDYIVKTFSLHNPDKCGSFIKTNEYQDYNHKNLYHYIVEYVTNYIDDTYANEILLQPIPINATLVADIKYNI